ncbi:hypothetical protein MUCCIDRAFT_112641 [Mucor lusitanicus CBS 277.49]|uniref:Uncharacterized protein n=1 Tax=Mucor lusitanicus CBS 277.49 TaxID=747725 RepID=A0A168JHN6_MUCCL|nr:hypothetical protein MUCCIDRAFT_112641 [Mucor lusitanicus CBS 277.49]
MANNGAGSNADRKRMEQKKPSLKRMQKNWKRTKKYYQRKVAHDRVGGKEQPCVAFAGNCSGLATYIKGNARRSTRPYYKQLAALEKDLVLPVDEYKSTVFCSLCFERTSKQPHVRNGKLKRIPGAIICYNVKCPRRLTTRATTTTTNRDRNGAYNIALIGFSRMASTDGLPLPPFRRSSKSNK